MERIDCLQWGVIGQTRLDTSAAVPI